jgi:hypothetical protein
MLVEGSATIVVCVRCIFTCCDRCDHDYSRFRKKNYLKLFFLKDFILLRNNLRERFEILLSKKPRLNFSSKVSEGRSKVSNLGTNWLRKLILT